MKRCPCAGHQGPNPVPLSGFYRSSSARDGHQSWCKPCMNRANRRWKHDGSGTPGWKLAGDRKSRARVRDRVLHHYGRVCACCGSTEDLTVDHVEGGGAEHREELFGRRRGTESTAFYRWLIENGFPEGFQALCRPCNSSKQNGAACRLRHARPLA